MNMHEYANEWTCHGVIHGGHCHRYIERLM